MSKGFHIIIAILLTFSSCEWQFSSSGEDGIVTVDRYDRIQNLYLTTGDFSALQQMNTAYPMQTRTLIEDVLQIGKVDDQQINKKFLSFYQDSTLQSILAETGRQYANMDDINLQLTSAFDFLKKNIPNFETPVVYSQVGALDQSIIVGNNSIGICLDKYLGAKCPIYQKKEYGYTKEQLEVMDRRYIVPDCIGFYLLSLYPMPTDVLLSQQERDIHIGKIQWVVNKAMGEEVFRSKYIQEAENYMKRHVKADIDQMLRDRNY